MKVVLIVIAVLVVIVGLILVVGAMLPRQHQATREITLDRPPHEIYSVVRDSARPRVGGPTFCGSNYSRL